MREASAARLPAVNTPSECTPELNVKVAVRPPRNSTAAKGPLFSILGPLPRIESASLGFASMALRRAHATIFWPPSESEEIERLRDAWDPGMAEQIAAHVTVIYPEEVPRAEDLRARLAVAAEHVGPFRLRAGGINIFGRPEEGVYLEVADIDGGWRKLRDAVGTAHEPISLVPHITLVHPRTSRLGRDAWKSLEGTRIDSEAVITAVTVTGFDGARWRILQTERLGFRSANARRGRA